MSRRAVRDGTLFRIARYTFLQTERVYYKIKVVDLLPPATVSQKQTTLHKCLCCVSNTEVKVIETVDLSSVIVTRVVSGSDKAWNSGIDLEKA